MSKHTTVTIKPEAQTREHLAKQPLRGPAHNDEGAEEGAPIPADPAKLQPVLSHRFPAPIPTHHLDEVTDESEQSRVKFRRRAPHEKTPPPGTVFFDVVVPLDGTLYYLLWMSKGAMQDYKTRAGELTSPAAQAYEDALLDREESKRLDAQRDERLKHAKKGETPDLSDLETRAAEIVQVNVARMERIEQMPDELDGLYDSVLIGRWVGAKGVDDKHPVPYDAEIIREAPRPLKMDVLLKLLEVSKNGRGATDFLADSGRGG